MGFTINNANATQSENRQMEITSKWTNFKKFISNIIVVDHKAKPWSIVNGQEKRAIFEKKICGLEKYQINQD